MSEEHEALATRPRWALLGIGRTSGRSSTGRDRSDPALPEADSEPAGQQRFARSRPRAPHLGAPKAASAERSWWRPDIQGLRAVAVLGVVAYHTGLPLPGGFTGVDVFFVISGFVIGALILRELSREGGLSGTQFYLRRARRLLPAAALMLIVVLGLSAVLISPLGVAQQAAGRAASAAAIFLANFYFVFFSGGYFDSSAETNPFLHMWSLSVEEQFYLVLPWLLVAAWLLAPRSRLRSVSLAVGIAWLLSFAANIVLSYPGLAARLPIVGVKFAEWPRTATQAAFFMPVTRSWEFLTGVGLAILGRRWQPSRAHARWMGLVGILLVAVGYVWLHEERLFPGALALIPVVGTGLLIAAGGGPWTSRTTKWLSLRPFVVIGDVSYGWYLWHWPLIVFAVMWFPDTPWIALAAGLLALVPTFLSYRFVEEPIRHRQYLPRRGAMATVAIACIAVPCLAGAALVSAWRDAWWHPDVAELVRTTTMAHRDVVEGCTDVSGVGPGSGSCHFAAPGATRTVLLIGDSNAGMYVEPMLEAAKAHNVDLEVATRNGCPFVAAPRAGNAACRDFVRSSIAAISTRQPPYAAVVVVNSGKYPLSNPAAFAELAPSNGSKEEERGIAGFAAALAAMVDRVSAHSPVVLIESIPQASGKRFPRCLMPSLLAPLQTDCARFDAAFLEANRTRLLKAVRAAVGDRAVLFDPAARLCSGDGTCSMFMGDRLVYRDESHLSVSGSLEFTGDLTAVLEQVLERPSPAR